MPDATDHISSAEAAAICSVDRATFNRWAARGKVPVVLTTPSGARIFSRAAIRAWADAHRREKVTAA